MNNVLIMQSIGGVIRTLGAALSGYLIAQGVDAGTSEAIVGAVGTLAVAAWSIYSKKNAPSN